MVQNEINRKVIGSEIREDLAQIKEYLESLVNCLTKEIVAQNTEIKVLKEEVENRQHLTEGNRQLTNKLLGDISKLQNDVEWYKKTYEQRSFFGTIREKMFRRQ